MTIRSLGAGVYLPTVLFGVGQGAVAPVVALAARELGASVVQASLVVALLGVGQLLGDLPAGALAGRFGERRAMLGASLLAVLALAVAVAATSVWLLGLAVAANGFATAVWQLARQSYVTEVVPYSLRARALSALAGARRFGFFVGPFLGALLMSAVGTDGGFLIQVVAIIAATGVLLAVPDHEAARPSGGVVRGPTTWRVVRDHASVLRTLGTAAVLVGAVRASRQAVLPLWADHIGLDAATTSLVFGLAGLADMLLFYPAGQVMDRFGRRWIGVPSMLVMGCSHLVLPLAQELDTLIAVALLMGVGNGMSSGILMVLGADASPDVGRAQFLGAWRLCSDAGNGAGPLLLGAVVASSSLAPAIAVMGGVSFIAAGALHRWIPTGTATSAAAPQDPSRQTGDGAESDPVAAPAVEPGS